MNEPATSDSPENAVGTFYQVMDTRAEAREAIRRVIKHAKQSLVIFDRTPETLKERELGRPESIEILRQLMLRDRNHRVRIALNETLAIESELPRLVALLSQFGSQLQIHRTVGVAREIQDVLMLADSDAVWRKPVATHPRSIVSIGHIVDIEPYVQRFEEIWLSSEPAVSDRMAGL